MSKAMTRGEIWFERREKTLKAIENGKKRVDLSEVDFTANLPKPLPEKEALEYYNKKLKRYWIEAGYYRNKKLQALERIKYWVEKVYEQGFKDGKTEAIYNGKGVCNGE